MEELLIDEHTKKITALILEEVVKRFVTHDDSREEMRLWGVLQNVISSVLMERRSILRDCPDPENRVGLEGTHISNEDVRDAVKNGCLYELNINIYTELNPDDWWYHWA